MRDAGASSRRRPSHTLAARADLANAYHAAGRLADAATLLPDTLSRCEQELPPGDPLTLTLRHAHDLPRRGMSKRHAVGAGRK